eukprot:CAMPEP_0183355138 /NCGR_PEP_ID=MMETSP0164_2-20130417/39321_1 /TAXON_ID=221442 /ORGANISM="Coccolithus pelagicus ssp braarudi, Strain PLY182g" /LENGTH=81 /DNA_ID=CAMNT_0025528161 /DNA_START=214 /DNA_END=459 /DNA_ORIENTATION=+
MGETILAGVVALGSIAGFIWMLWELSSGSVSFLASLDRRSPSDVAIGGLCMALAIGALYYAFYPEGSKCPPLGAAKLKSSE